MTQYHFGTLLKMGSCHSPVFAADVVVPMKIHIVVWVRSLFANMTSPHTTILQEHHNRRPFSRKARIAACIARANCMYDLTSYSTAHNDIRWYMQNRAIYSLMSIVSSHVNFCLKPSLVPYTSRKIKKSSLKKVLLFSKYSKNADIVGYDFQVF